MVVYCIINHKDNNKPSIGYVQRKFECIQLFIIWFWSFDSHYPFFLLHFIDTKFLRQSFFSSNIMERNNYLSGSPWESIVGYSRLVKYGPYVFISGTTSIDEKGKVVGVRNPYVQTKQIIQTIEKSLRIINANLTDIVRTRIFVTNIDDWKIIGKAYAEFFKDIQPAATMVEVKRLIQPDLLVEIEADAITNSP